MEERRKDSLQKELVEFQNEKEKIRNVIGQIGGKQSARRDTAINVTFIAIIAALFLMDVLRHIMGLDVPLPPLVSIEVSVLLVSIKIIWMIHKQSRVEHFQFWILNAIEFRLNEMAKQLRRLQDGQS
jgi:hypothetical protein